MAANWTDLVDPTRDELLNALAVAVDPDAVEILVEPARDGTSVRPLCEGHGRYVVAILAFPRWGADGRTEYLQLGVLATPTALVTVRKTGPRGQLVPPDSVAALVAAEASPGAVFQGILDEAGDTFLELLDGLYEAIDELEGDIEQLRPADVRRRIAFLRHELLLARRASSATRGIVRRIVDGRIDVGHSELFPSAVEKRFVDTYETLVRVTEELDVARDLLGGVRDYYQAKITEQQNEVGKKLTMIASLVLVPSFIVGFYGQNFAGEFRAWYWGVGVSVGLIVATTIVQLVLFRWRRWL